MIDDPPSGNAAWFGFLEIIACAFAFEGVSSLLDGKPWMIWLPALAVSPLFFLLGVKVPWIRANLSKVDWHLWSKRIDRALRITVAVSTISCVAAAFFALREWHKLVHDVSRASDHTQIPSKAPPLISPANIPPVVAGTLDWRNKQNWRHNLKTGMTETEVSHLFGSPQEVEQVSDGTFWHYGSGEIDFFDGKLYSWYEPSN